MLGQDIECGPGVVPVVAFTGREMGIRQESGQVGISLAILGQQDQVACRPVRTGCMRILGAGRSPLQRDLRSEYVADAMLLAGLLEADHAIGAMSVGDGHGGHAEAGGFGGECLGRRAGSAEREPGAGVQMYEHIGWVHPSGRGQPGWTW